MTTAMKEAILTPISPKAMENIITRLRKNSFRPYMIHSNVREFWLYQTAPVSAIAHLAAVGHAKRHGDVSEEGL